MHPTVATFVEEARDRHDVEPAVEEFEDGTKTATDAAEAIGCSVSQIASSIVMVGDGQVVVVVTSGANRVDEDHIAAVLGVEEVRMADPEEAKSATGWSIGGVPPICHDSDLPVLFDETLLDHGEVWAAAGTPTAVWPVDPEELVRMADASVVNVT
ncbi:MAG: YbaK/EbsC family protein [Halodesulfurarchaeum sp.]